MRTAVMRLALLSLLAAVPALAPAQDGDEAKKLFDAMEERLTKAKSVSLAFRVELMPDGKEAIKLLGSLAFAEGSRVRLEAEGAIFGEATKLGMISDGKRLRLTKAQKEGPQPHHLTAPKNLSPAFARVVGRSGLFLGLDYLGRQFDRKAGGELRPDELFPVSDLKLGGREKVDGRDTRMLTYAVQYDARRKLNATLWIDAQTGLPLKRVLSPQAGAVKEPITETYTDWKLNKKVEAKQFELPK